MRAGVSFFFFWEGKIVDITILSVESWPLSVKRTKNFYLVSDIEAEETLFLSSIYTRFSFFDRKEHRVGGDKLKEKKGETKDTSNGLH